MKHSCAPRSWFHNAVRKCTLQPFTAFRLAAGAAGREGWAWGCQPEVNHLQENPRRGHLIFLHNCSPECGKPVRSGLRTRKSRSALRSAPPFIADHAWGLRGAGRVWLRARSAPQPRPLLNQPRPSPPLTHRPRPPSSDPAQAPPRPAPPRGRASRLRPRPGARGRGSAAAVAAWPLRSDPSVPLRSASRAPARRPPWAPRPRHGEGDVQLGSGPEGGQEGRAQEQRGGAHHPARRRRGGLQGPRAEGRAAWRAGGPGARGRGSQPGSPFSSSGAPPFRPQLLCEKVRVWGSRACRGLGLGGPRRGGWRTEPRCLPSARPGARGGVPGPRGRGAQRSHENKPGVWHLLPR